MKFGVFLPVSGRAAMRQTLTEAARRAEASGFSSVWAADRIVIPWRIETPYPYAETERFIVPPGRPFLEPLTCLAFLAGVTTHIELGISVLVVPYRHPLHWAKTVVTIDQLCEGRFLLGVGVGWMREEFDALGAPFDERGAVGNEQLEILSKLWSEEHVSHHGDFYRFDDIAFEPKPFGRARIPVWVGGESLRARRRAARYGDAWFPYYVQMTSNELQSRFDTVRRFAKEAGRDPETLTLACCLPIEVTDGGRPEPDSLKGNPDQLVEKIEGYRDIGVKTLALQFMAPRWPERIEQIERFGNEVIPHLQ